MCLVKFRPFLLILALCLGVFSCSQSAQQPERSVNPGEKELLVNVIKIRDKVKNNLVKLSPKGVGTYSECKLRIQLSETGDVLGVTIEESSGNKKMDKLVKLAVQKSSPLPLPKDPVVAKNFRDFSITFIPSETK